MKNDNQICFTIGVVWFSYLSTVELNAQLDINADITQSHLKYNVPQPNHHGCTLKAALSSINILPNMFKIISTNVLEACLVHKTCLKI